VHILLTDQLTCPRCGPDFGLIVLADSLIERRVLEGSLGCANCRNEYPIRSGVADLRSGETAGSGEPPPVADAADLERAFRLAALAGVGDRSGPVLVRGVDLATVAEIARLLPNAQVFGSSSAPPRHHSAPQHDWVVHGASVPLRDRSLIAAALVGAAAAPVAASAARLLVPDGHLVLERLPLETVTREAPEAWSVVLEQDGFAVASRRGGG
jgi:uncharacterized protein YbaR (Trm112 family)